MERTVCTSDHGQSSTSSPFKTKFCFWNLTEGISPLRNHQRSPLGSLKAQILTCANIWKQDISTYNSVSYFSSAALRRGSFFHSLEIFMAEFSWAEMLSNANFPLFKIPKQWSYTIPVFPILLVSGRTLFHCGEQRGGVDMSAGLGRAAKYHAVILFQ